MARLDGAPISERGEEDKDLPWAHPNSRFATALGNVATVAADASLPTGVPDRRRHLRRTHTRPRAPHPRHEGHRRGVYDGLTLGAEATFAAEGVEGQLRYDPMSMRPFMSYSEGDYAAHWLKILWRLQQTPVFAHVNWFQRDPDDGRFLWPGYREPARPPVAHGFPRRHSVRDAHAGGHDPGRAAELDRTGLEVKPEEDIAPTLSIDVERWKQEMGFRAEHLGGFANLPEAIRGSHADR